MSVLLPRAVIPIINIRPQIPKGIATYLFLWTEVWDPPIAHRSTGWCLFLHEDADL